MNENSISENLWEYLSPSQQDLMREGFHLFTHFKTVKHNFKDYSFLLFTFAKVYEGFLKQAFLDAGFITENDYQSTYFRIGKVITPNLIKRLGSRSVYKKISDVYGSHLAQEVWETWKKGRNEVMHYFPSDIKYMNITDAEVLIQQIVNTMEKIVKKLTLENITKKLTQYF